MSSTVSHLIRLRLDLAYDGSQFHGWAAQPGLRTVEGRLTEALSTILRKDVALTVAGRTDAGVHARGQVAHMDVSASAFTSLPGRSTRSPEEALRVRLSALLARDADGPKGSSDVVVHSISRAPEGFDARFSALSRSYTYRICDDPSQFDPLRRRDVLWVPDQLDVEAMNRSAIPLLGEHDFISYCKPREGATTIRTLQRLGAVRNEGIIEVTAQADAFCHSMVRTLVGTLMRVGDGSQSEAWPAQRLIERSRDGQVVVAPPHPLTLERVTYPDHTELAARARQTRAVRCLEC
ncbi:tRNA pseudouridine(38-40) synthase TruA [Changpingibacter yushuensis]|uniref:tRNA pseudouridine(38-40) synthase TruA n=1 Tax=Changpingibacter yushuensis TaxID=2758440 RepID=UPI00165E7FC6|nr:tRNA pseudouridine(38-40) synthase TruA [Changpingibacter yushuensis]